jgi:hypothetical protein
VVAIAAGGDRIAPAEPLPLPTPAASPPPVSAPQQVAPPMSRAGAPKRQLEMPDGTLLAPLNGAVDPPKPRWQRGRPYSPVVGVQRLADGRDTYVHADGSRTTTFMTFRTDLGREVAVTHVLSPAPAQVALDDSLSPRR